MANQRIRMIVFGGVALLAVAVLTPMVRDALRAYERSGAQLQEARGRLHSARDLREAIEAERGGQNAIMERINAREARFDLFAFTNRCLRDFMLESRANLERRQLGSLDGVQVTLKGVNMQQLIDFLYAVYSSNNLIVLQRLDHLRPARDGKGLECLVTLVAPKA